MENNDKITELYPDSTYSLGDLQAFTGLTDRTLRNYLAMGILQGEKRGGVWHFSAEQVTEFMMHPTVRPSIVAKNNALAYDFLLGREETEEKCCIVLDLPKKHRKNAIEYFCNNVNKGEFQDMRFSLDSPMGKPIRIILKGNAKNILRLINGYYETEKN